MNMRTAQITSALAWLSTLMLMLSGCEGVLVLDQKVYSDEVMGTPVYLGLRGTLPHINTPPMTLGAFGYVVFTSKPDSVETKNRYLSVCNAFITTLQPIEAYKPSSHVMPTYWPVRTKVDSHNCEEMLAKYDYERAELLASYAGKQSTAGPLLVAWDELPEGKIPPSHQLVFDLSHFSNDDMQRAFLIWKGQLARDPSRWEKGFDLVKIREDFRSLLIKYGDTILTLITKKA